MSFTWNPTALLTGATIGGIIAFIYQILRRKLICDTDSKGCNVYALFVGRYGINWTINDVIPPEELKEIGRVRHIRLTLIDLGGLRAED